MEEYFVGNIRIDDPDLKKYDAKGIKYRIGDTAKYINGKIIKSTYIKPLYIIGESSLKKWNDFMMGQVRKIKRDMER